MINLGDKVKDRITGFTGIAICKAEWLNGCIRWTVQPTTLNKDGTIPASECIDEQQLGVVQLGFIGTGRAATRPGGPYPAPRRHPDPVR